MTRPSHRAANLTQEFVAPEHSRLACFFAEAWCRVARSTHIDPHGRAAHGNHPA